MFDTKELLEFGFLEISNPADPVDRQLVKMLLRRIRKSVDKQLSLSKVLPSISKILGHSDQKKGQKQFTNKFLNRFPNFYPFIKDMNASAEIDIECCERIRRLLGPIPASYHCMEIKRISNFLHAQRWTRPQTNAEKQGSVSILGSISEKILQKELGSLASDEKDFFMSSHMPPQVRAYGDFVLMCQPNNLWISVKSGFSRERLLASGYTNDLIGVGFFQDGGEFTSAERLRNFKKAGFLAIYLPDEPVTLAQTKSGVSTYAEVVESYGGPDKMPSNISGTALLRRLSTLHSDLAAIVEKDLKNRNLSGF